MGIGSVPEVFLTKLLTKGAYLYEKNVETRRSISLALALAACHSTQNQNTNPSTAANNGKAQTYAMGQKGGLTGNEADGGQYGSRYVNPMQAPSHQVYYFAFDQSTVSSSDMGTIAVQAKYLVSHRNAKVRLEGNTDDRGSREYNVGLGWRRAKAVANVLNSKALPAIKSPWSAMEKSALPFPVITKKLWSLNRRVELIYVQKY